MKKMNLLKVAVAIALLFTVNMNANAQFGGLKGLAKKAKQAVTEQIEEKTTVNNPVDNVVNNDNASDNGSASVNDAGNDDPTANMSSEYKEIYMSKKMGGLDKYLGLTEGDDALVYSYYKPGESDFRTDGKYDCAKTYGNQIAQKIVEIYRYIKSDEKLGNVGPEILRDFYYGKPKGTAVVTGVPELNDLLEHAMSPRSKYATCRKGEANVLMSKADADAFKRAAEKAKKAWEEKFGAIPRP